MRRSRTALVVAALLLVAARVHADGGVVVLDGRAGPFLVTAFAAPVPLRVGPVDLSVLVRDADGAPVLDADVHLVLELVGEPDERRAADDVAREHGARGEGATVGDHAAHGGAAARGAHGTLVVHAEATRAQATNKLLRAALVELPSVGRWQLAIDVVRDGTSARLVGPLRVGPPLPAWTTRWLQLILPAVAIALFLLHRRLSVRRAPGKPG